MSGFEHYTLEAQSGLHTYRLIGHRGLERSLLHVFHSLRDALRRHPRVELVRRPREIDRLALKICDRQGRRWL